MLNEMKTRIPVVVINQPKRIYDVERKIDEMLEKGVPYEEISKEISKLRKYSFQSYIKKNLQALQTDPKNYHRCI